MKARKKEKIKKWCFIFVVHKKKTEGYTHNWNFSTKKKAPIVHKEFKKKKIIHLHS